MVAELQAQQRLLIKGSAEELHANGQACQQALAQLEQVTQARLNLQQTGGWDSPEAAAEGDLKLQTQFKICLQAIRQRLKQLRQLQTMNQALIAQAQQLNEQNIEVLMQLQQQGQPAVYGAAGDYHSQWQAENSVYDFNA